MEMIGTRVRLLLGDDNSDVLQETCTLLSREFDLVATAENGARLIMAAQTLRPDIIVTDINMPELNGIEASRRILKLGYCQRIIILSIINSPEIIKSAFDAGVSGYVLKENAGEDLIPAIRSVVDGKRFLSSGIRSDLVQKRNNE